MGREIGAQPFLVHLAAGQYRQLGDQRQSTRHFVARQPFPHTFLQHFQGRRRTLRGTTTAQTASPHLSSGTPTTAQAATPSTALIASSTSGE